MRAMGMLLALVWVACEPSGGGPADAGDVRQELTCDAVYVPSVTFVMIDDATGEAHCGPAKVGYVGPGDAEPTMHPCSCSEGKRADYDGGANGFPCHVNPPAGETSVVHVEVEGYEAFTAEVSLPWECHPQQVVEARLVPKDPPTL